MRPLAPTLDVFSLKRQVAPMSTISALFSLWKAIYLLEVTCFKYIKGEN